jgi:hypothetical protein
MSAFPGGALRALQHDQNPPGSCANVCVCVHVALDPRKGKTIARAQVCSRRHLATFHLLASVFTVQSASAPERLPTYKWKGV